MQLSADKQYLLWPVEQPREIFRHSKVQKLKIFDIKNSSIVNLFDGHHFHSANFQFAQWGPNGSQVAFVFENNVYYKHSARSETIRLTISGVPGVIFNGHCDWLYEEEILLSNSALWFSPTGQNLAYLQINDSLVDSISWNNYGDYYNATTNQYPQIAMIRYPKPGRHNPIVTVFVANLHPKAQNIKLVRIDPPKKLLQNNGKDFYISKVVWYDDNQLLIAWTFRNQQRSLLTICDAAQHWNCVEVIYLDF